MSVASPTSPSSFCLSLTEGQRNNRFSQNSISSPTSPHHLSLDSQSIISRTSRLSLPPAPCSRCRSPFASGEVHVMVDGTPWHSECFRCAQCFKPLQDGLYFNQDGRLYCQHDFSVLYAPFCSKCKSIIIGQVKRTLNGSFHSHCFSCEECDGHLDYGVWYMEGKMMCFLCKETLPKTANYVCFKCHQRIPPEELLRYREEFYHAYHFDCEDCKEILTKDARQLKDVLYCPRCYDLRCDICADCKTPIDHEVERSILAMGKHWHVDHFRCVFCGKPFMGKQHYEKAGKAYCEEDYIKEFGDYCNLCGSGLTGTSIRLFGKGWCRQCYSCTTCNKPLKYKDKVAEFDMRPMCKKCFKRKDYQNVLRLKEKEQATSHQGRK